MDYDFQADIGANIRDFQREMREVDQIIRETATGADAMIGADLTEFQRRMQESERVLEELQNGADAEIGADTSEFMSEAATVEAVTQAISTGEHDVEIGADIASAMAGIAVVEAATEALEHDTIWIRIRASFRNYQNTMGAIANFSRSIGEVMAMTGRGIMISLSPAIVPLLGSVISLIGNLGPMLGTLAGSTFALVSAFGLAGIGAAGFASVAVPSIGGVISRAEELNDLQDKMNKATTAKQYNKYLAEMQGIYEGMTKPQIEANKALREFKSTYSDLVSSMESPVLDVFASALTGIQRALELARPMIANVTDAVQYLMDAFNRNLESTDVKDFFTFLATNAAPALLIITKAIGNFMMGIFNLMGAFAPLQEETQNSFLGMSESFRKWTASLGENKKFQDFINYVSENMPKIRNIFGDAFKGIINTFAAFGPSSSDMMTNLQDMVARFKEWSSTLKENQGFQEFMDYLKETGPKVVELLGNLRDVFWEIAQALAPAGESILDVANKILEFTANLIDNNPWIGKLIAAVVVLGGAFLAVLPHIVLMQAAFGGIIGKMILMTVKTIWAAGVQVAKWIWMGTMATLNAIKVAAAWTLATGKALVVAVAKMIAATAVFIAKWALIGAKALLHAAKVAAAWLLSTGTAMVTALASMVATAAVFVAKWVWMGAQALIQAARMAAAWFIALGPVGWVIGIIVGLVALIIVYWDEIVAWTKKAWTATWTWIKDTWEKIKTKTVEAATSMWNTIKEKFAAIVSSVKEKMATAKATIQQKWEEAKAAAIEKLTALVTSVVKFFTEIVAKVKEKMTEAVENVSEKVGEMPGKVVGFVSDMVSAGGDLIQGLIDGAVGMADYAISSIKSIAGDMVDAALSFFKIKSPSRVFMEMGAYLSEGLAVGVGDKAKSAISSVESVARGMTNAFNPQLAMADMRASAHLDTSVSRADMGVVRKSFAAEVGAVDVSQGDTILQINSREFARWTANDIKRENERNEKQSNAGRKGRG